MFVLCLEEHKANSVCLGEGIKVYQCVCVCGGVRLWQLSKRDRIFHVYPESCKLSYALCLSRCVKPLGLFMLVPYRKVKREHPLNDSCSAYQMC